jgi:ApaG protein
MRKRTNQTLTSPADASRGSRAVTSGISVEVWPRYVPSHSVVDPPPGEHPRYVFLYRIRIANEGEVAVQLLSRRWLIVDGDGERHEVVGDGVVGQQPRLEPGAAFEYESFCPLVTPWGTMEGSFRMQVQGGTEQGRTLDVEISRFYLASPQ